MKACPTCGRLYPDDAGFCPVDGARLTTTSQAPPVPNASDARIGTVVCGKYEVRRVVADGGMGRVYEALELERKVNVALKILHAEVARDPVQVERFKREFEVSGQLPHEHIVDVFDFQPTPDGSYALAMEFLYGEELSSTLGREAVIHPGRLVRMVSQVALGLDQAHARKLVHRDLKPDNVFLCQTHDGDMVKVLDFGSVKDKAEGAKKLTVMGTTIGSPFYMAPEQAQGLDTLDQRADVWALAAITYECVTGRVPFQGQNGPMILLEILTKEAKPPSVAGAGQKYPVPPTLDPVIARAFKKAAAVRTPSVGKLADEVGAAYGLEGDHKAWALLPEAELVQRIEARLPELMTVRPEEAPLDAVDDFFGESDALGAALVPEAGAVAPTEAVVTAPRAADPMTQAMAQAQAQTHTADEHEVVAQGLPTALPRWLVPAVGGAVALVVVLVFLLVLL